MTSNAAPQYKQVARVGGLALEHALHLTSSDAANARGFVASIAVVTGGSSVVVKGILAAIIHADAQPLAHLTTGTATGILDMISKH
ncbi:MAG TPA: hypothetical protein VGJ69_07835 [Pyrinomonadaceae bacterium]